jgi:hypothetical protein
LVVLAKLQREEKMWLLIPALCTLGLVFLLVVVVRDVRSVGEFLSGAMWGLLFGLAGYFVIGFVSSVGEGLPYSAHMKDWYFQYFFSLINGWMAFLSGRMALASTRSPIALIYPLFCIFGLFFLVDVLEIGNRDGGRMPGLLMAGSFGFIFVSLVAPIVLHHFLFVPRSKRT